MNELPNPIVSERDDGGGGAFVERSSNRAVSEVHAIV